MNIKRLLAVASLAISATAAADTPRLLKNGRPACGNVPKKSAMDDEERACLREARERAKQEQEQARRAQQAKQAATTIAAVTRNLLRAL